MKRTVMKGEERRGLRRKVHLWSQRTAAMRCTATPTQCLLEAVRVGGGYILTKGGTRGNQGGRVGRFYRGYRRIFTER